MLVVTSDDPITESLQKLFKYEKNWYNQIKEVLQRYRLDFNEDEIRKMDKYEWRCTYKEKVRSVTVQQLMKEKQELAKGEGMEEYRELAMKQYLYSLSPTDARMAFKIRAEMWDIKTFQHYKYGEGIRCRVCDEGNEDLDHIVNECSWIERGLKVVKVHSENEEDIMEVIRCVTRFRELASILKD